LLISRASFFHFWTIFTRLGRFWSFSGPDFPVFVVFAIFGDVSHAFQSGPCTIGHSKQVLKPRNWAPKVSFCPACGFAIKSLVSLDRIVFEYSQDMLMTLAGPTPRTRYSSARGGGLDTLFPLFFYSILGCQVSEFSSTDLGQSHETPRNKHFRYTRGPRLRS
jgi:hypothetical protein